jgi:class 3 adenylate cyclase/tetratricopeptide (TPR) repeat protein
MAEIRVCPKCGEENPERAKFCLACASPLADVVAPRHEQRKVVTIVFSDLTGSTSLGERLDAESLRQLMARYYQTMREALEHHGGSVEKFIGDAVMAVFGIPVLHEDDALRAVRAAWEMSSALEELNNELEARWGERLQTRTGVNTGEIVAGDPSDPDSFAVGDAVNVAARFEQTAGAGEVLIGDETYRLVRHAVSAEPVEPLSLKGKSEPAPAFRLLSVTTEDADAGRMLDSPLVGRERELRLLLDAFERVVEEDTCRLAVIRGPAGVGKSRLCREFLAGVGERATVLNGHCLPYGEGITLWPVAEVVKLAAEIVDEDSAVEAGAKIAGLVDAEDREVVAERVAAALALSDAIPHAEETFWALRRLLESLAAKQPLIVVFDDVHWGEQTFLDLIEYLVEMIEAAPVLLLCLARLELDDRRPDFGRTGLEQTTELTVGPLDSLESRLLMDNLLGEGGFPRALSERIASAAEGNALFVEEMLRTLVDKGKLVNKGGGWQLVGDMSDIDVPPTIQALLAARLEGLDVPERSVIERAAVIGQEFWRGAVSELSPEDTREVVPKQLEALVRKELVERGGTPFLEEEAFRFSHLMVRDVAYAALLKEMRADLHERFAEWLEESAAERAGEYSEIIGYHLEQAARYRSELAASDPRAEELAHKAATRLGSAGQHALARGDMSAATNLLERSLALSSEEGSSRAELMLHLGAALVQLGELTRADAVLTEAIEKARAARDQGLEYDALVERAFLHYFTAQSGVDETVSLAEKAVAVFEKLDQELGRSRAYRLLSAAQIAQGRMLDATRALERGIEHARRAGSTAEIAELIQWLVWTLYEGPLPARDVVADLDRLLGGDAENPVARATRHYLLGAVEGLGGHFSEAREQFARGRRIYAGLGLRQRAAQASIWEGEMELLARRPEAAEPVLRAALETLLEMGERGIVSDAAAYLALAELDRGELRKARKLGSVSDNSHSPDDRVGAFSAFTVRAKVEAAQGDAEEAEKLAREAVTIARESDTLNRRGHALTCLAEILASQGHQEDATPLLREAIDAYDQKGNVVSAGQARARLQSLDEAALPAHESP